MASVSRAFVYRALGPNGARVSDVVHANDRAGALVQLARSGVVLIDLAEAREAAAPAQRLAFRSKRQAHHERILFIRQLGVMARARIDLMEAIDSIRSDFPDGETRVAIGELAAGLRRGAPLGTAFAAAFPGLPPYVHALIDAGAATGRIDRVLEEAGRQLAFERDLRGEMRAALAYPAFLLSAGVLAALFMFMVVVPRFAAMIGARRESVTGFSAWILDTGEAVHAHPIALLVGLLAAVALTAWIASEPATARFRARLADRLPVVQGLTLARQRSGWARIMAFAMGQEIDFLRASRLAAAAAPPGSFRDTLAAIEPALRSGKTPADAIGAGRALPSIDLSLVRAGQRAGALAEMFEVIADRHERALRDALKRTTRIAEQVAIALVSTAIGAIVIGLVTAMTSVYDSIR